MFLFLYPFFFFNIINSFNPNSSFSSTPSVLLFLFSSSYSCCCCCWMCLGFLQQSLVPGINPLPSLLLTVPTRWPAAWWPTWRHFGFKGWHGTIHFPVSYLLRFVLHIFYVILFCLLLDWFILAFYFLYLALFIRPYVALFMLLLVILILEILWVSLLFLTLVIFFVELILYRLPKVILFSEKWWFIRLVTNSQNLIHMPAIAVGDKPAGLMFLSLRPGWPEDTWGQ